MKIALIILTTIVLSCNNTGQTRVSADSIAAGNDSIETQKDTTQKDTISNTGKSDSIIHISFPRDSTWATVSANMKGVGHPITVYIPIKQGRRLTASISSDDSAANIRINQIITPDGKADGPFGKEWKFALHQQGMYRLLIGENLMQGDEWKGEFKLTIKVE